MQVVLEIDISRSTSTICELIGQSKNEITITNDRSVFTLLLKDLATFYKSYSQLQASILVDCKLF